MQLRHEQLAQHLKKQLASIYWISGEEILFVQEACDAIRTQARSNGFNERQIFHVETGFSWPDFMHHANTRSLFSNKQLFELRLPEKINEAAGKALLAYAEQPPNDKILLISSGKVDATTQKNTWFQTILKNGVFVALWPLEKTQLPQWIAQRLASVGLTADADGIQILSECGEGNLLAAAQEIEKLRLLHGTGKINADAILDAVADNARFDIFNLSDAALLGNNKRVVRIINSLKEEGIEPPLILWSLTRELRQLASLAHAMRQQPLEKVLVDQRVWEKRKPLIRSALKRHSTTLFSRLLQKASYIDRLIKGLERGNIWDELCDLGLAIAGAGKL